jgi:PERQ amino acid-rich with GYF domain-containing protein
MYAVVTSFQADLAVLPLDTGLIADAVYANSTTMDGRHFSEEYVRRKRLADKGVIEKQTQAEIKAASSSGGWNEVAKKSGAAAQPRESEAMQSADFKVVPGRKKSKK